MLSDPFASRHPIRGRSRSAVSRAIVALALAVPILSDAADADPPRSVSPLTAKRPRWSSRVV